MRIADALTGGPDGGFRRTVHVPQLAHARRQCLRQRRVERLATAQRPERGVSSPASAQQHVPGNGRGLHQSRVVLAQKIDEETRITRFLFRGDDHRASSAQGRQQLEHGDVERQGGNRAQGVACLNLRPPQHAEQEVGHRASRNRHALGLARGTRGVDDVGGCLRRNRRGARWRQRPGVGLIKVDEMHVRVVEERPERGRRDDAVESRVLNHVAQALARKRGIQRHVGGPAAQDRQHRGNHVG